MNAVTTTERNSLALPEAELLRVLGSSLYPGANPDSIRLVLGYCKVAGLDPMQKPVHIVPMWDNRAKAMRDVVMPGIGMYRVQAARSGCAGVTEPEFGPDVTETIGGQPITFPAWCRVSVMRRQASGEVDTFSAKEFWRENYAVRGGQDKSIAPNAMWTKRPYGQLAKCAEAQALRKAFPEIGSQPAAEEMEGKPLDAEYSEPSTSAPRAEPKPTPTAEAALQPYPQERFDANLPEWTTVIQSGRHTADRMIAMLSTKGVLSDAQKKTLRDLEVFDNEPADGATATNTQEPKQ